MLGTSLLIDYRPRRVDVGALCDGNWMELVNLVRESVKGVEGV